MKFSYRVFFLSISSLSLVALHANADNGGCKDVSDFRAMHSPSSANAIKYVCKPYDHRDENTKSAIGAVSVREVAKLIARRERPSDYRFPATITDGVETGIVATIQAATKDYDQETVRICRSISKDAANCAVFDAAMFLDFAQTESYCAVPADTQNKVELIDYKDPVKVFTQGHVIPNPPAELGGPDSSAYQDYKNACFAEIKKSTRKRAKKAAKEDQERHDAFVSACQQAVDRFWVKTDAAYADQCGEKVVTDALDLKTKLTEDARKKAQEELDKQNKSKVKDLEPGIHDNKDDKGAQDKIEKTDLKPETSEGN